MRGQDELERNKEIHRCTIEMPAEIKKQAMDKAKQRGEAFVAYINRITKKFIEKNISVIAQLDNGNLGFPLLLNDDCIHFRIMSDTYRKLLKISEQEDRSYTQLIRDIIMMDLKGVI